MYLFWKLDCAFKDEFIDFIRTAVTSKRVEGIQIECTKFSLEEDDLKTTFLNSLNQFKSMVGQISFYLILTKLIYRNSILKGIKKL